MVGAGLPQTDIALALRMSLETLHQHYGDELRAGQAATHAMVGGKIIEACKRGEEWALKFFAARRMGWIEKTTIALGEDPDNPLPQDSPYELARRIAFLLRTADPGADGRSEADGRSRH